MAGAFLLWFPPNFALLWRHGGAVWKPLSSIWRLQCTNQEASTTVGWENALLCFCNLLCGDIPTQTALHVGQKWTKLRTALSQPFVRLLLKIWRSGLLYGALYWGCQKTGLWRAIRIPNFCKKYRWNNLKDYVDLGFCSQQFTSIFFAAITVT